MRRQAGERRGTGGSRCVGGRDSLRVDKMGECTFDREGRRRQAVNSMRGRARWASARSNRRAGESNLAGERGRAIAGAKAGETGETGKCVFKQAGRRARARRVNAGGR